MRHGTAACYKNGCRLPACTEAQTVATREVRKRQRAARISIEERLAARLRYGLYYSEPWLSRPAGITEQVWRNEIVRMVARLEKGNAAVRRAA